MPLHVSCTRAHCQEAKIVLYNLWYHHTYRWPSRAQVERGVDPVLSQPVHLLRVSNTGKTGTKFYVIFL